MTNFLSSDSAWGGQTFQTAGILTGLNPIGPNDITGGGGVPGSAGNPLPNYPNPALAGVSPSYMAPNVAQEYQNYLNGGGTSGGLATPSTTIPQSAFSSQGVETMLPGADASSQSPGILEQFGIGAGAGLSGGGTSPDASQQNSGSSSSGATFGEYFIRGAVILLGLIFIAAGLFMFKPVNQTVVKAAALAG